MMGLIRVWGTLLAGIGGLVACWAQPTPFVEHPGVEEFTGMLIVRPLRWSAAAGEVGASRASLLRLDAKRFLSMRAIRSYPEVEEYILRVPKGWNENTYSDWLIKTGLVEYAVPNWRVYPATRPDDPKYIYQWHHSTLESEGAWNVTTGDPSIIIAVVDSGVDIDHPDLSLVSGYHYVNGIGQTQAAGGNVDDCHGHGTEVAGVAGAIGNNGEGVCGMGWGFKIRPVRVSDNATTGAALLSDIVAGARWAGESDRAQFINVSMTGVDSPTVQTAGDYVRGLGAILVWAAGNEGITLNTFDWADVLIVGATDQADARWTDSNYGLATDVFAPGTNIITTQLGGGYGSATGTSVAAPMVCGQLAMMLSANPTLSFEEFADSTLGVENNLLRGSKDIGTAGEDNDFGWGRINSYESTKRVVAYNIQELVVPGGPAMVSSEAFGICPGPATPDFVVGTIHYAGNYRGWRRIGGTTGTLLNLLGGTISSQAFAVNHAGNSVGYCTAGTLLTDRRPCIWNGLTPTGLANPWITARGWATSINSVGNVAGNYKWGTGPYDTYGLCWFGGTPNQLLPVGGYTGSYAFFINDANTIVGYSVKATPTPTWVATKWVAPAFVGTVIYNGQFSTVARHCNSTANIATGDLINGSQSTGSAFASLMAQTFGSVASGTYPSDSCLQSAESGGRYNQHVGRQYSPTAERGVFWNNNQMQLMNNFIDASSGSGWQILSCNGIDKKGLIVGRALRGGVERAFIATAVKELGQTSVTVSSSVYLEDFLGDTFGRPITFIIKSGAATIETIPNVTPSAPNTYTFSTLERGTYDVYADAPTHLRKKVTGVVFSDTGATAMSFSLRNGDTDDDNDIDARDLKTVKEAMITGNLLGDVNGDSAVNATDLAIVKKNYGRVGD